MAARLEVHPLPPFDPVGDPTSIGQRWKTWTKRFETYIIALDIKDDKQKRALFLYQAGQETQEIFDTLTDTGDDYKTAKEKLDNYFLPKKNVDFETFKFRQTTQKTDETIDQFITRLRKLALHCEFHDLDKELKATLIQNCSSKRLRRFALREEDVTLEKILAKARALEASESQATGMERSQASPTEVIQHVRKSTNFRRQPRKPTVKQQTKEGTCRQCGYTWPHTASPCPAKGKTCRRCGKPNHFAKMCRSKPTNQPPSNAQNTKGAHIHHISTSPVTDSDTDDDYLYTLEGDSPQSKIPKASIHVNSIPVDLIVDTGASTDILDESTFASLNKDNNIQLQPTSKRLFAYGSGQQLPVLGKFSATLSLKDKRITSLIHVLEGNHGSLLSYQSATDLGILDMHLNHVASKKSVHEGLCQTHPDLFRGIGKLKGVEVKLHINPSVPPVAQPARRIPFHLRKKVEQELHKLEQQDIIERVEGPTPWVSPLVVIPKKNGDVRICVDMRMANEAIKRERHPTPTIDDLIHTLNGATVFSKLDLRSGYHQLTLTPESRSITTFATHKGLRRYKRLNFGTNSASEIFQKIIQDQIRDIPGSLNISDDVVVFGRTQAEHDDALRAVFHKFSEVNLTLNRQKCEFNKPSITFFGFVFSGKGISPDPTKVEAIKNVKPPTTISGVRSFLGMATYCAKFIPNFSSVSQPLRDLTKKDAAFQWSEEQERSFNSIKELLTSAKVLAYFDPHKQTELITDASPFGLSAILLQKSPGMDDRRVVAYASRSLSDVETRYSQTEKEALAIVWAIERLHLYLFGKRFTLITDCKPIQLIFGNPKSRPPARIERWNLRLQCYDFDIIHIEGNHNPSDFLSRHSANKDETTHSKMAEEYVNFLSAAAVPKAMTLEEIKKATSEDITLQHLADIIRQQSWNSIDTRPQDFEGADLMELKRFRNVKRDLTVNNQSNVILRNGLIVVPTSLRHKAVSIAHQGHQGLVKTKKLLREKIWFPGLDAMAKDMIDSCLACQANGPENNPDPLQMSPLPPTPWHTVNMDFCGPFPMGEYLFVIIDAYSRFPEVEIVSSTSAATVIPKLNRVFSVHGMPYIVRSDNGPPFNSEAIKQYMVDNGIEHRKVTPLWPQANSEAESFMRPLTKAIRSANVEGKLWKKHLYEFLLNYRTTPHTTTGFSPAELLFNRKVRNKLPHMANENSRKKTYIEATVQTNDDKAKEKMKQHADRRSRAKPAELTIGDKVLVKQRKSNKLTTRFDPNPFMVVRLKGTMVTASRNGKYITRNISHFKKFNQQGNDQERTDDANQTSSGDDEDDLLFDSRTSSSSHDIARRYPQRNRATVQRYGQNVYDC